MAAFKLNRSEFILTAKYNRRQYSILYTHTLSLHLSSSFSQNSLRICNSFLLVSTSLSISWSSLQALTSIIFHSRRSCSWKHVSSGKKMKHHFFVTSNAMHHQSTGSRTFLSPDEGWEEGSYGWPKRGQRLSHEGYFNDHTSFRTTWNFVLKIGSPDVVTRRLATFVLL